MVPLIPPRSRPRLLAWSAPLMLLTVALLGAPGSAGPLQDPPRVPCSDPRGCPDLVVDPDQFQPRIQQAQFSENDCNVVEGSTQSGARTLLRFAFTSPNIGPGDLIIGPPSMHPEWFEDAECHGHQHLKEYADYRLWTPQAHANWTHIRDANPDPLPSEVLADHPELLDGLWITEKRGFCVIDVRMYEIAPPKYFLCGFFQGISVGWADEYHHSLDGQFVDITDVAPGKYILEAEVNAERLYEEADYGNNRAWMTVDIP